MAEKMSKIRVLLRNLTNSLISFAGLRVVNKSWGPKGFLSSLKKLKLLSFEPELIIDVGAARGEWSLECFEAFPESNYLLIDPLPENIQKLEAIRKEKSFDFW